MLNLYFLIIINLFINRSIDVNPTILELGEVQYNNYYKINFKVINNSKYVIRINNVIGDCGCLDFKYSKKNIYPGNFLNINGVQKIIDTAEFTKNIIVYTNSKIKPFTVLKIHGKVSL